MRATFLAVPVVTVLALLTAGAGASPYIYDGFATPGDYTAGANIAAQTGGGSGAWAGNYTDVNNAASTASSSLTYSTGANELATSDGSLSKAGAVRLTGSRAFTNDPTMYESGDQVWFSALFNRSAGTSNMRILFGAAAGETVGWGFSIENSSYDVRACLQGTPGPNYNASTTIANGQTVFVIGRLSVDAGASGNTYHVVDVWVNPDLTANLAAVAIRGGDNWVDRQYAGVPDSAIMNIYSHQNNTMVYDEIRMGLTQADVMPVVPEPATMILLAAGGLLVIRRRR